MTEKVERKDFLLRLPKTIYEILENLKKESGMSVTSIMYNAIFWYLTSKGLIDLEEIRKNIKIKEE